MNDTTKLPWDYTQSELWNRMNNREIKTGTNPDYDPAKYTDSESRFAAWVAAGRPTHNAAGLQYDVRGDLITAGYTFEDAQQGNFAGAKPTDPVPVVPVIPVIPDAPPPTVPGITYRGPVTWPAANAVQYAQMATDAQPVGSIYTYWLRDNLVFNPLRPAGARAALVEVYDAHTAVFSISLSQVAGDFSGECKTIGYPGALYGEIPLHYAAKDTFGDYLKLCPEFIDGATGIGGRGLWLNVRCDSGDTTPADGLHVRKIWHWG